MAEPGSAEIAEQQNAKWRNGEIILYKKPTFVTKTIHLGNSHLNIVEQRVKLSNKCLFTIAILNPIPSSPRRFSLGITQSSNIKLHVDDAFIPSLFSLAPNDSPSIGLGNIKQLMP